MNISKKIFLLVAVLCLVFPLSTKAFWPWSKNKTSQAPATAVEQKTANEAISPKELSASAKILANNKYKLFEDSFEKKDVEKIIANKNNFWFSISELNYLFNTISSQAKNPVLNNLQLESEGSILKVSADFKKFIRGRASFNVSLANRGERLNLNIDRARLYGLPVPSRLISNPLNKALDDYFNFLYEDERYQGYAFSVRNEVLKLDLNFR
jgi:hypothetical protein